MPENRLVTNLGDTPFSDAYDGVTYVFQPGQPQIAPVEATNLWFGDPALQNTPRRRFRDEAYARLLTRGGFSGKPDEFQQNKRQVKITSVDGALDYIPLQDDPEGNEVHQAQQTVSEHVELIGLIERQQAEITEMREMLKAGLRSDAAYAAAEGELPEDTPEVVPSAGARKATKKKATKKKATKKAAAKQPEGLDEAIEDLRLGNLPVDGPS